MTETQLHIAIADYLRTVLVPPAMFLHPANGGLRSKREASLLKAMGVRPGVSDIVVLAPWGKVCFLEVKTDKGRESPEQKAFAAEARLCGFVVGVVRSIDDVRNALKALGITTRESVTA